MTTDVTTTEQIIYRNITDLRTWAANYRQGDVGAIITSILKFGFNGALRVWRDNTVMAGNHTLLALRSMQAQQLDAPHGVIVTGDGDWLAACIDITHLSETEARAFAIADNRTTELATNDAESLAALLQELAHEDDALLMATGFDGDDLDMMLAELGVLPDPEPDPGAQIDRAAELQAKWGTERGQIWQVGTHRIMCGNSTNADDVRMLMDEKQIEVVWTDPPYGVAIGDKNKLLNAIGKGSNRVEKNLVNDKLDEPELAEMLISAFDNAIAHCSAGAAWYVAVPAGPLLIVFGIVLKERGVWRQTIQWVKNNSTFSPMGVDYHWQAESILYGWLPNAGHRYYGGRTQTTVWEIDHPSKSPEHPTMKPVELVSRAVENSSRRGECIYDPFLGSGTTLIACEQTGRVGYGMEIDEGYTAVALERLANMGLTAELID